MKNIFPLLKENHQELHAMGNLAKSMISQAVRKHEQDDGPNFAPGIVMLDKMWLGIDFNPNHIENYDKILANMLAVDNLSCHKADISSVYMKVIKCGKHVGTLMEDFSHNGTFEIFSDGVPFGPCVTCNLDNIFKSGDITRTVFAVLEKGTLAKHTDPRQLLLEMIIDINMPRMPIADLDHVELLDRYQNLFAGLIPRHFGPKEVELHLN